MSRVLFLSRWFPYPPANGSKLRIFNLMRALANDNEVTLISFADQPELEVAVSELAPFCKAVHVIPWYTYNPNSLQARLGFFRKTPRFVLDTYSPQMSQCIADILSSDQFDVIVASQLDMAVYRSQFKGIPALFEEAEVGTLFENYTQADSRKGRLRHGLTWQKHRRYLGDLINEFDLCTVVSSVEKDLLAAGVAPQTPIEIIPNCVNTTDYASIQEQPRPNNLIFTGAFTYQPNYQAMVWFLEQVFPKIRTQIPETMLTITGNHANKPLPTTDHVTLTGFVDDVRPLIARAWASLVPIWQGGGTRLKILEAMALNTPIITTTKGAEGLAVRHGQHVLIADTAVEFADATLLLLRDEALRQQLVVNARRLLTQQYDWPVVAPRFLDLVDRVSGFK